MYDSENYTLASTLFVRLLGLIYLFAFFPFIFEIRGLIGSRGVLPASYYLSFLYSRLNNKAFLQYPTLFWLNCSDTSLVAVPVAGSLLSLLLLFGVTPLLTLSLLIILYMSIIRVGQVFLSFGWELFLIEISINALLLTLTNRPNPFAWVSINLLLFRFHLQAGAVKLQSGDPSWRNLTALSYHYFTQPIPNAWAWYAAKLPLPLQKASCALMLAIEILFPFAIFGSEEARALLFSSFLFLQFCIWLTGNFSYLNYMTAAFSTILLSDTLLSPLPLPVAAEKSAPLISTLLASAGGIALITLQLMRLWTHFFRQPEMKKLLNHCYNFYIANRYALFAVMTTKRYEIVIEGSLDGVEWREYTFKYKPSGVDRRPRRVSPYQPRLDWQMWFLPFTSFDEALWFQNFMHCLLMGRKEVLSLLSRNPFPDTPPKYLRAVAYDYRFSSYKERKTKGCWWNRTYVGNYSPTLSLKGDVKE